MWAGDLDEAGPRAEGGQAGEPDGTGHGDAAADDEDAAEVPLVCVGGSIKESSDGGFVVHSQAFWGSPTGLASTSVESRESGIGLLGVAARTRMSGSTRPGVGV